MRLFILGLLAFAFFTPAEANGQFRGNRGGNRWYNPRPNYGYRDYYGGYRNSPTWSFGWGNQWPGYYSAPRSYYYDSVPRTSYYYESPQQFDVTMPSYSDRQARLEIRLSDPNDEVIIQGQRMSGTGTVRHFVSPELTEGRNYNYTISIRRANSTRERDETRSVDVQAGSNLLIDFTRPLPSGSSSPASPSAQPPE